MFGNHKERFTVTMENDDTPGYQVRRNFVQEDGRKNKTLTRCQMTLVLCFEHSFEVCVLVPASGTGNVFLISPPPPPWSRLAFSSASSCGVKPAHLPYIFFLVLLHHQMGTGYQVGLRRLVDPLTVLLHRWCPQAPSCPAKLFSAVVVVARQPVSHLRPFPGIAQSLDAVWCIAASQFSLVYLSLLHRVAAEDLASQARGGRNYGSLVHGTHTGAGGIPQLRYINAGFLNSGPVLYGEMNLPSLIIVRNAANEVFYSSIPSCFVSV